MAEATAFTLQEADYRIEGPLKVTGAARYAADFAMPGMLWLAYVRSPYPHARIAHVDITAARSLPGVHAVLTGADLPEQARFGRRLQDYPVLARDRARFVGDRIVAVAGETREIAEQAARLVSVDYEVVPAILSAEDAVADGAPILHPDAESYTFLAERGPRRGVPHPNVQGHDVVLNGTDAERMAAFGRADRTFEHMFRTPRLHQGYIEPHACVVWTEADGRVHVISTNKSPFHLRQQMSTVIGVAEGSIVVHSELIGGDFGGKGLSLDEYTCYFLARATGRPVKAVMTYVDELGAANPRHAATIRLRTAVDRDGRFLAHESHALLDGGAYAAGKPLPLLTVPAHMTLSAYHVPQARLEISVVYTNQVPCGHNRAPGDVQATFATESHIDMIARAMGVDAIELRLRNIVRDGLPNVAGHVFASPRGAEVLEQLRREVDWERPLPRGRGRGIAIGQRHVGVGKTAVTCRLRADGRVEVVTGAPEQGTGTYTVMQRLAAQALSVPLEHVRVRHVDTSEAEPDGGIGGSRATNVYGHATSAGAVELKATLTTLAAEVMGWPAGEVELRDGVFRTRAGHAAGFLDVTRRIASGAPVEATGTFESHPDGNVSAENFCGYAVEVAVDTTTGQVTLDRAVFVADVGAIVNPVAHAGQVEGGFVYGLGSGVMEDLEVRDGQVTTLTLGEYKLPSTADVPPLRVVLLPAQAGPGPLGAKAAGELTNTTVAPSVANAVAAAVGARVTELPISSERVLAALERAD